MRNGKPNSKLNERWDWIDLSKPHVVLNGKVYHFPCVIAATSRKVDVIPDLRSVVFLALSEEVRLGHDADYIARASGRLPSRDQGKLHPEAELESIFQEPGAALFEKALKGSKSGLLGVRSTGSCSDGDLRSLVLVTCQTG